MIEELEKLVRRDIEASGRPQRMNVNLYKSKFSERLVRLSVLRAAFLTGVAVAGYRMIPLWDPIRRQPSFLRESADVVSLCLLPGHRPSASIVGNAHNASAYSGVAR